VTDADGNTTADQAYVFVPSGSAVLLALASGPEEPVGSGAEVTLSSTGSLNIPEESAQYAWSQLEGPNVQLEDAETPSARFTAPEVAEGEVTLLLRLTLTNNDETAITHVEVTVVPDEGPAEPPEDEDEGADGGEDVAAGEAAYAAAGCAACHAADASGGSAPALQGPDRLAALEARLGGGGNHFGTTLTDEEIAAVAAWLATLGG
jgi:mono/diheme cytochrome c family protein